MERLFAPWRMKFIEDLKVGLGDECFLCALAKKGDDAKKLVLARGKNAYVVFNRYPYNCGHLMIVPYNHTGKMNELSTEERSEIMELSTVSMDIISDAFSPDGFNCGFNLGKAAGAGVVHHLHMHIVPRWIGDSNFLPIIGGTKSMPEYLDDTYKKLKPLFSKWERAKK